jgi:hypothetical protein
MTDKDNDKDGKGADSDRDSVDKLPLSVIPLSSSSLRKSRLVKNTRLETMVELHNDPVSGSLQIRPEDIPTTFPGTSKADQEMIAKLASLNSYDVYSLRASLKSLGIEVDASALALSAEMQAKLDRYSLEFTRPLILNIFGDGGLKDIKGMQRIFHEPDVAAVQDRLKVMSQKIGIPVHELPEFLLKYRDLFLSTLYYRENFETMVPEINRFWLWLADLKTEREVAASAGAMASCRKVMGSLRFLFISTRERLTQFRSAFDSFWTDMTNESFKRLTREIEDNHVAMGAVLCGLSVKIRDWSKVFPDDRAAGPASRVHYVISQLEPGLEKLTDLENDSRKKVGLRPAGAPAPEESAALKILALLIGHFKCLSGDVWRVTTFTPVWEKDEEASHLNLSAGLAFAAQQGWITTMDGGRSYRLTEDGFDRGITLTTKA